MAQMGEAFAAGYIIMPKLLQRELPTSTLLAAQALTAKSA